MKVKFIYTTTVLLILSCFIGCDNPYLFNYPENGTRAEKINSAANLQIKVTKQIKSLDDFLHVLKNLEYGKYKVSQESIRCFEYCIGNGSILPQKQKGSASLRDVIDYIGEFAANPYKVSRWSFDQTMEFLDFYIKS